MANLAREYKMDRPLTDSRDVIIGQIVTITDHEGMYNPILRSMHNYYEKGTQVIVTEIVHEQCNCLNMKRIITCHVDRAFIFKPLNIENEITDGAISISCYYSFSIRK